MSKEWGPSNTTEFVEENKRKNMSSNIFGGGDSSPSRPPVNRVNENERNNPYQNKAPQVYRPPMSGALVPSSGNNMMNTVLPSLSTLPEIRIESPKSTENFDLGLKPRAPLNPQSQKRLTFQPSNQMKALRDNLAQDLSSFSNRMQKLSVAQPIQLNTVDFKHDNPPQSIGMDFQIKPFNVEKGKYKTETFESSPGFSTHSEFILPDGSQYM